MAEPRKATAGREMTGPALSPICIKRVPNRAEGNPLRFVAARNISVGRLPEKIEYDVKTILAGFLRERFRQVAVSNVQVNEGVRSQFVQPRQSLFVSSGSNYSPGAKVFRNLNCKLAPDSGSAKDQYTLAGRQPRGGYQRQPG
jgi:hypothetical protein